MIGRLSVIVIAGTAAVALVSALAAPAASDAKGLLVRTRPGFKMKLTRAGREIDYIRAGKHKITIRDTSRSHSVELMNPLRVRHTTLSSLAFVGTKTVTVTLTPDVWYVSCKRHWRSGMRDGFRVQ